MALKFYFDIVFHTNQGELSGPVIANQVMPVLHGAFKKLDGTFALALPNCLPNRKSGIGNKLRIFTLRLSDINALVSAIKDHFTVRDYCEITPACEVPEGFAGPWVEYRRYRPSNKNAERNADNGQAPLRERRIRTAGEQMLPYFVLRSTTNQHGFSLIVEPRESQYSETEIMPDSYGLSVSSRSFAVPQLP